MYRHKMKILQRALDMVEDPLRVDMPWDWDMYTYDDEYGPI